MPVPSRLQNLQIFGTKKCADTRRAERFFRERRLPFQMIDLAQKGASLGELRKLSHALGGIESLLDREGKRYVERGLKYAAPTGPRIEQALLEDPLLMRTPVVRMSHHATVGFAPDIWLSWLSSSSS